eukprot:scaffold21616_cov25-Phaeocystis_antarctica.AAC.1
MSDELPPPPVSKTRASQIAINFAGRVKHQMKDERKQVALAAVRHCIHHSLVTRPARTYPPHPHCPARGSGPRSTRSSRRRQCARWRSSCVGAAAVLTSYYHSPLASHHSRARCLLPYYALLPRAATTYHLPLITHHSHFVVRSEDKKLTKDKEKGDADRILRRYAILIMTMPTL